MLKDAGAHLHPEEVEIAKVLKLHSYTKNGVLPMDNAVDESGIDKDYATCWVIAGVL